MREEKGILLPLQTKSTPKPKLSIYRLELNLDTTTARQLMNILVSDEFGGSYFVAAMRNIELRRKEKFIEMLDDNKACGKYIRHLLYCANNESPRIEDIEYYENKDAIAKSTRQMLEQAVGKVDREFTSSDDEKIMRAFRYARPYDLMWASKRALQICRKILREGPTSGDEEQMIRKIANAIGRIDMGQGSGDPQYQ